MDCHSWRRELPEDGEEAADLENSVASVRSSRLHLLLCVYVYMCLYVYMCVYMYNVCIMPPCCLLYVVSLLFILSQIIILHCDLILHHVRVRIIQWCSRKRGSCAKLNVLSNRELICMWKGTSARKKSAVGTESWILHILKSCSPVG